LTVRTPEQDAIRLIRGAIKTLLRRFGLQCIRIERVDGADA
jgi:hypothetical protein